MGAVEYIGISPAIEISKSPDFQTILYSEDAAFTISVTNTGNITLTNIQISDPTTPDCETAGPPVTELPPAPAPGSSTSYSCTAYNVVSSFTNTIITTAEVAGLPLIASDNDAAFVEVSINPSIIVSKSPEVQILNTGDEATFTITVTNTGDITLTNILLDDPLTPDCALGGQPIPELPPWPDPGYFLSYTCSASSVAQSFTNVITATAQVFGTASFVSDSDDAVVELVEPSYTIYLPVIWKEP
jgi:uncharacterized repeat protein (TIGR01451 family)